MDPRLLAEATLSYYAVYDEELRDEMEDLGLIGDGSVDEERAPGVKPYKPGPTGAEVRANAAAARRRQVASGAGKAGYGPEEKFKDWKDRATPSSTLKAKDKETGKMSPETVSQRMNREKPYVKRMTGQMAREYGSRAAERVTRVRKGAGEPQAVTFPRKKTNEQYDLYDYILSHLLDEGYADSIENAEAIMVNMSEEWIASIID